MLAIPYPAAHHETFVPWARRMATSPRILAITFIVALSAACNSPKPEHAGSNELPKAEQQFCDTAESAIKRLVELKSTNDNAAVLKAEENEASALRMIVGKRVQWIGTLATLQGNENPFAGLMIVVKLSCAAGELTVGSVQFSGRASRAGSPPGMKKLSIGDMVLFTAEPEDNAWRLAQSGQGPREYADVIGSGHFAFRFIQMKRIDKSLDRVE